MRKVSIVQEYIPSYRIPFFEKLKASLTPLDIDLHLHYGLKGPANSVTTRLPWSKPVRTRSTGSLTWQSVWCDCHDSELIITPQQVRHSSNLLLQLSRGVGSRKHAFWGHGKNFNPSTAQPAAEMLKRILSRRVDWWFAYNDLSKRVVTELGFPSERITIVQNSVDTTALQEGSKRLSDSDLAALRKELGITSSNVAVYTGVLGGPKRIGFLLESCAIIKKNIADFHLIVIGDGEDRPLVDEFATRNPWVHAIGATHGLGKIPYWAISNVLLMPGGVGLVILDSFALGVPMITTENSLHGPEISYLRDGYNGLIVRPGDRVEVYAQAVIEVLQDKAKLNTLRNACLDDASNYSIEDMVERFAQGVLAALEAPRYRVFF